MGEWVKAGDATILKIYSDLPQIRPLATSLATRSPIVATMPPTPITERRTVLYTGHVQGVGFRYTAQGIARRYDVTGYVRNLPDGRVELVAEGDRNELAAFLDDVRERMRNQIRDEKVDRGPPNGEFSDFSIRH
jgi:acylphosphatase